MGMSNRAHAATQSAHVEEALQPLMRATLEMGPKARTKQMAAGPLGGAAVVLEGMLALPSTPKAEAGTYWGYTVRIAKGLTAALSDSPFEVRTCSPAPIAARMGCTPLHWHSHCLGKL